MRLKHRSTVIAVSDKCCSGEHAECSGNPLALLCGIMEAYPVEETLSGQLKFVRLINVLVLGRAFQMDRKTQSYHFSGFPGTSAGKESACNAADPGSIPGLGRSPGEGIGYPLQYSWASLVAQMVKNPPAMRDTWVQSLGRKNSLEEGMGTHSSILT